MNFGIKNKYALVTGAGRGIGQAIAIELAREGVKVAITARTKRDLEVTLRKMGGVRKGHIAYVSDLTGEHAPENTVKELKKNFQMPDIVINNLGGTLSIKDPFCTVEEWRRLWRLNIEVALELNNLTIPHMRRKKWGRIVNVSSISAIENQGPVPYCTMKAALTAYTRSMARIVASDGIIMTAVLPGAIFTKKGYWDIVSQKDPEHVKNYLRERMRIGRFGRPEEIAPLVVFLCSKQASFCVGTAVTVDGGQGRTFLQ